MSCLIRAATPADIPAMHAIRLDVRENRLSDPGMVTDASYRPYVAAGSAWVAELPGGMAGFAVIDRPAGNVWALFVAPEAEGQGVGRTLHEAMLAWARQHGLARLWLSTSKGTRAERFYARAGWEMVGPAANGELRFERSIG
jgi:GNAT superfamily N-acetyltransferase